MPAHRLNYDLREMLATGFAAVKDPGDAGTLGYLHKGIAICEVVTAGAETRTLPNVNAHAVGERLLVILKTDGGNLTLTGAANGSVILDTAGQKAEFVVVDNDGTKQWNSTGVAIGERTRQSSAATSGAVEGIYTRLALTADGTATGEALRSYTNVEANIANAYGAHISLSYSAVAGGSETSGLGAAVRGTVQIPNVASWAPSGTVYAGLFEIFSDGASSDPAGLTELAGVCISNSGNATGAADVDTDAFILSVQGFTAATGVTNAVSSTSLNELPSGTVGLRVKVGSTAYYIPAVAATAWN